MALDPRDFLRPKSNKRSLEEGVSVPLAGTRRQRNQRLQFGLFGLATMALLVGLADIIQTSAQQTQATAVPDVAPTVSAEDVPPPPRDPLADAGVVPDRSTDTDAATGQQLTPQDDVDGLPVPIE